MAPVSSASWRSLAGGRADAHCRSRCRPVNWQRERATCRATASASCNRAAAAVACCPADRASCPARDHRPGIRVAGQAPRAHRQRSRPVRHVRVPARRQRPARCRGGLVLGRRAAQRPRKPRPGHRLIAVNANLRPDRHALLELDALLSEITVLRDEGDAARFSNDPRYRWVLHRLWIAAGNEALACTTATGQSVRAERSWANLYDLRKPPGPLLAPRRRRGTRHAVHLGPQRPAPGSRPATPAAAGVSPPGRRAAPSPRPTLAVL